VRTQLAGLRIDNLKLFFNTERELIGHIGFRISSR
jgi:hypothetical protein